MRIDWGAQQVQVLEGINARYMVMGKVQSQNGDQHQQAAKLGKRKNFTDAHTPLRSRPQMEIRKYMGISIISQEK